MLPTGPKALPDKVRSELPYSRDESRGIAAPDDQGHSGPSATISRVSGPSKHVLASAESLGQQLGSPLDARVDGSCCAEHYRPLITPDSQLNDSRVNECNVTETLILSVSPSPVPNQVSGLPSHTVSSLLLFPLASLLLNAPRNLGFFHSRIFSTRLAYFTGYVFAI